MPTSGVLELQMRENWKGVVLFQDEEDDRLSFRIDEETWKNLGSPKGLRVRIEDTWNDPNRTWGQ